MTAAEIIEEIKHLQPRARAEVESFVRRDESVTRLTPAELDSLAKELAESEESAHAEAIEEKIVAGFYGKA